MILTVPVALPGELADPLPFPGRDAPWWVVPALLALVAAWALIRRWRQRRRSPAAVPASPPPPVAGGGGTGGVIRGLRQRHLAEGTYREGCHELAATLKGHFEGVGFGSGDRPPCTRMTAWEIAGRVGDRPVSRLFSLLAGLQFGRSEPDRGDFQVACEAALGVVEPQIRSARPWRRGSP